MRRYGGIVIESTRNKLFNWKISAPKTIEIIDKDLEVRRYEEIVVESIRIKLFTIGKFVLLC